MIKIWVENKELDLDVNDLSLSFIYSINSLEDISKINGSHSSRAIKVPTTKGNVKFFERFTDPKQINPNATIRKKARIEANGITVFSGTCQLASTDRKYFKLKFVGNNASWFLDIKNKKTRDYDFGTHIYNSTNVQIASSWIDSFSDYVYILARIRDWEHTVFNTGDFNIRWTDFSPSIFLKNILDTVFNSIGYTLDSEFFETDEFKKLIFPVPKRNYSKEWHDENISGTAKKTIQQTVTLNGGSVPQEVTFDEFTNGANYDGNGNFVAPYDGLYKIRANMSFDNPNNVDVILQGYINGDYASGVFLTDTLNGHVNLNAGDTVKIYIDFHYDGNGNAGDVDILGGILNIEYFLDWRHDCFVDIAELIRDWDISSIIKDITLMFGLVWDTNADSRTIKVEPRKSFFVNELDLTNKVDVNNFELIAESAFGSEYQLHYLSEEEIIDDIDGENDNPLYSARYEFDLNRFKEGIKSFTTDHICKTVHILDDSIKHDDSDITPQVPYIEAESEVLDLSNTVVVYSTYSPRILYFAGRRAGQDGYINHSLLPKYDFPSAFMVNYNDHAGTDPVLSFGNTAYKVGLMHEFHLKNLVTLEVGKKLELKIRWSELMILNLDWSKNIIINNTKYILQEINGYRLNSNGHTKTVLLKSETPTLADADKIVSSTLKGIIEI